MKKIRFTKMSGAGNDFIVITAQKGLNYKKLTTKVCDRTNGIGADGLLIVEKSRKADYKMRIINADGSEAEMCGNGARCFAAYVAKHLKPKKKIITFETLAGIIQGQIEGSSVNVHISDPSGYKPHVPIIINHRRIEVGYIDTGVPHAIVYVAGLDQIDVPLIGSAIRYHHRFKPRGANVNFVEQISPGLIQVRTYERGVENETRACGTGSVAACIVTVLKAQPDLKDIKNAKMKVLTKSREMLEISFDRINKKIINVWLKGSAHFIATGEYYFS